MQELISGAVSLLTYFVIAASCAVLCRFFIIIPDEIFRKLLHCILLGSIMVFVFCFDTWWVSALAAIVFAIIVYPILAILEHLKHYSEFTTERKKGELKSSLLLVFGMFAFVIAICWGYIGDRYLVLASVYAWGFGDAAAALIGKKFGKHKIQLKYTDGKKSVEGTTAMFLVSFFAVIIILLCRGGLSMFGCFFTAICVALASTFAELYSKNGMDTVICPISSMIALLLILFFLGGLV